MSGKIAKVLVGMELIGAGIWGVSQIVKAAYHKGQADAYKDISKSLDKMIKKFDETES